MTDTPKPADAVSREQAEEAVRVLLRWAGEDPQREGLLDTPKRVAKAYRDWFSGYALDPDDYARFVQPFMRRIFTSLSPAGVPMIHFGVSTATLLSAMRTDGATVIGLDWRVPLDEGWAHVGHHLAVQGNLDPVALFAPRDVLEAKARDVLDRAGLRAGHIFNLGHGFLPGTPLDNAIRLAEHVREESTRLRDGEPVNAGSS